MIVVIQCAARKSAKAGSLLARDGRKVLFVARPAEAPPSDTVHYAHPNEMSDQGMPWRDVVVTCNRNPANNPYGLIPAIELYAHPAFARLGAHVAPEKLFILSAGWGLIPSTFLTPLYDITFSAAANVRRWKRRRKGHRYNDLSLLPPESEEGVVFFGGKDYLPLFCELTRGVRGPRTVIYNAAAPPALSGCRLVRYETTTRTNWHYGAVDAWMAGKLVV
jgi:hypothetical protein